MRARFGNCHLLSAGKVTDNGPVFSANLHVRGADSPDLMTTVSTYFAEKDISFERMRMDSESGPFGSCTLFEMDAVLSSSEQVDIETVLDDLRIES